MTNPRNKQVTVGTVRFWGEQDGPPERELKERLTTFFENRPSITTAFLANVTYGDQKAMSVALCLRADSENQESTAKEIGGIFASLFGRNQHLDIIFLNAEQEAAVAGVCSAFFRTA